MQTPEEPKEDCNALKPRPKFMPVKGKINTEYELKLAAELIAERKMLKEYREKVQKMQWSNDCRSQDPILTMTDEIGKPTARVMLPRWILNWIDGGLENKIDGLSQQLLERYGIEQ